MTVARHITIPSIMVPPMASYVVLPPFTRPLGTDAATYGNIDLTQLLRERIPLTLVLRQKTRDPDHPYLMRVELLTQPPASGWRVNGRRLSFNGKCRITAVHNGKPLEGEYDCTGSVNLIDIPGSPDIMLGEVKIHFPS